MGHSSFIMQVSSTFIVHIMSLFVVIVCCCCMLLFHCLFLVAAQWKLIYIYFGQRRIVAREAYTCADHGSSVVSRAPMDDRNRMNQSVDWLAKDHRNLWPFNIELDSWRRRCGNRDDVQTKIGPRAIPTVTVLIGCSHSISRSLRTTDLFRVNEWGSFCRFMDESWLRSWALRTNRPSIYLILGIEYRILMCVCCCERRSTVLFLGIVNASMACGCCFIECTILLCCRFFPAQPHVRLLPS